MSVIHLPLLSEQESQDDCWGQIGVHGDRSCPELAAVVHCRNCRVFASAGERLLDRPAPPDYVAEWTERLATPVGTARSEEHALLVFRLGEEWLGIETRHLVEITLQRRVHRIPHRANAALAGLVNVRGRLEIQVSLAEVLKLPRASGAQERARLVVLAHDRSVWVFEADEVSGVHHFRKDAMSTPPVASSRGGSCVRGLLPWKKGHLGFLDGERLFAALDAVLA